MEKFIRAIFVVGMGSNVEIANYMKTKKTAQTSRDMSYGSSRTTHTGEPSLVILIPVPYQTDSGTDDAADALETATGEKEDTKETATQLEEVTTIETKQAPPKRLCLALLCFCQKGSAWSCFYTGFPVCSRRLLFLHRFSSM